MTSLERLALLRAEEQMESDTVFGPEYVAPPASGATCTYPGCTRWRRPDARLCYAHARRKERGMDMDKPIRDRRKYVRETT